MVRNLDFQQQRNGFGTTNFHSIRRAMQFGRVLDSYRSSLWKWFESTIHPEIWLKNVRNVSSSFKRVPLSLPAFYIIVQAHEGSAHQLYDTLLAFLRSSDQTRIFTCTTTRATAAATEQILQHQTHATVSCISF